LSDRQQHDRGEARHRVAVVVGPGRSGTSATTGALRALSVDLGNRLKPALRKNAKGFFEDLDLLAINYRLHETLGLRPNGSSLSPIDPGRWHEPALAALRREAVQLIRLRFGASPLWGFKCGGVLRVLPFWEDVLRDLDLDIVYVVAIRNPLSVAASRAKLDVFRGVQEKSDLELLAQIVPYFRRVLARPFVVVDYDRMIADADREIRRMAQHLQVDISPEVEQQIRTYAASFLTSELRHHSTTLSDLAESAGVNPLTRDAYLLLLRLASDSVDSRSTDFEAEWRRIEAGFSDMAPLLRHIDHLEDQLRGRTPSLKGLWRTIVQHLPVAATLGSVKLGRSIARRQIVRDT
jgi:hypothetical protein